MLVPYRESKGAARYKERGSYTEFKVREQGTLPALFGLKPLEYTRIPLILYRRNPKK